MATNPTHPITHVRYTDARQLQLAGQLVPEHTTIRHRCAACGQRWETSRAVLNPSSPRYIDLTVASCDSCPTQGGSNAR